MSSVRTRVAALSGDKRRLLLERLSARKQNARIRARSRSGAAPLSYAQQRFWFLQQFQPESSQYNLPAAVRIRGALDATSLQRTFGEIVRRHESLRTTFATEDGTPVQIVNPAGEFQLPVTTVSGAEEIASRMAAEAGAPFDLDRGPLFRAHLLRQRDDEHVLLLNAHHIVFDSWSAGILVKEILALYAALSSGHPAGLPGPALQYADYAAWQREPEQERAIETHLEYWRERLAGELPLLALPSDRPRPAVPSHRGALRKQQLSTSLAASLKAFTQGEGATLFMTLLTAFKAMLLKYSGQEDIVIGTPVSGRHRAETHDAIGCFVNTLALRTDCSGDPTFRSLLARLRESCLSAYAHQDAPFERVVDAVERSRDLSRTPVFQVAFGVRPDPVREYTLGQTTFEMLETHTGMSKFDLMLEVVESDPNLTIAVEYNTDLFDGPTMDRFLGHYETLLQRAVAAPDTPLSRLPLITDAERIEIAAWNQTEREYPLDRCLHALIDDQVARTPEQAAVVFGNESITYRELDVRANQLAHHLRKLGVGRATLVGVAMERSIELVVSLVAILKAGGAYVPIDPDYPSDRVAFMLDDAKPAVLLVQQRLLGKLPQYDRPTVAVDALRGALDREPADCPAVPVTPDDLAYVIYTSGSTGRPKGAMNAHRGIVNRLCWMQEAYGLDATDRVLQKTPFSFDVSVWEFFWPLMTGATLVVAQPGGHRDAAYLTRTIVREGITTLHFVPSMLQIFLEEPTVAECRSIRRVICSGEALPFELQQRFFALLDAELHNLYGPTEAAVDVTYWRCERESGLRVVPIGRPIANIQIHLLDTHMNPVPIGVPGELHIGGVGVGGGYLHRSELTAEKFVADAFSLVPGARLYKTGDLARYLPDGAIEYLGRIDHQVKIRGFRIELGEIEAVLTQHPAIRESVVAAIRLESGDKRLAAYVVPSGVEPLTVDAVRHHVEGALPDYMVPAAFVVLETLPLSPNGKVDRKALPAPDFAAAPGQSAAFVPPRTPTEELLAQIWTSTLGVLRVGAGDDFFLLGGHSLTAAQVASRIRRVFSIELPVRRIFEFPTLERLASHIDSQFRTAAAPEIAPRAPEQAVPLSYAQQRLWILDQLAPGSPVYHLPAVVRLEGRLNAEALEESLNDIVARHESLRTTFPVQDGAPVQRIHASARVPLTNSDLTALPNEERGASVHAVLLGHIRQPFDLANGPLVRALLVSLGDEDHVLAVTMHHIGSDGWSLGVFLRELAQAYAARVGGARPVFDPLPVQYADYAIWQRDWLQKAAFDAQLEYWRRHLDGLPVLALATDRPRPRVQTFQGARSRQQMPPELVEMARNVGRQNGATLFMVLLAAFQMVISRYTAQTDIAVGTPVANRDRAEIEPLIGFFVNTLVLRTRLDGDPSFQEILARVREVCLGAYANQDVPFARLVEELRPERHVGVNPLFQVAFALRDFGTMPTRMPDLTVTPFATPQGIAKFDLTMEVECGVSGLTVDVEYDTDLFDAETIDGLISHFRALLHGAVEAPSRRFSELPTMSAAEERTVIVEWNRTDVPFANLACVHELFEQQAARTPDEIAVVLGPRRLTYAELNRRANHLASSLRRQGVGPEVLVAVAVDRSPEMVVAILAVLKAGGAYLPIGVDQPSDRIAFLLDDASPRVLVSDRATRDRLPRGGAGCAWIDIAAAPAEDLSEDNGPNLAAPENLAYVIYTSGSTGRPKGVMVEHRGVCNLVAAQARLFGLAPGLRTLQVAAPTFDAAVSEIFVTLLNGGTLHLARREQLVGPDLARLLRDEAIEVVTLPPSVLATLPEQPLPTLRTLVVAGEACPVELARRWSEGRRFVNAYGPTETTVCATGEVWDRQGRRLPIGRPIDNVRIYIVDSRMRPVPVGMAGELLIGGVGVARGYLRRPDLTEERFVPDPFDTRAGARVYRTGDRARYRADGRIEFLGRMDRQVKIRGFRIEPGEVEAVLMEQPAIREALVVDREDVPGDKRLVAYITARAGFQIQVGELRSALRQRLPEYMVPSAVVVLDELPLTAHGKVNRNAIPAPVPERPQGGSVRVAPRTELEAAIARVWSAVLGIEDIAIDDNFFTLGGHSLLATQVASRLRDLIGTEVPLRLLFEAQTISDLAPRLAAEHGERAPAADVVPLAPRQDRGTPAPASYAQQRLWLLDRMIPDSPFYNVPARVRLTGDLDVPALELALRRTLERHEALRTVVRAIDGIPVQVILPASDFTLPVIDLSDMAAAVRDSEVARLGRDEACRPFDLSMGPLMRATLVTMSATHHVLLLTMHHIVCDGWSLSVFVRDLTAYYESAVTGVPAQLPALPIQYADFAVWQRQRLSGEALEALVNWWKTTLAGHPGTIDLPTDKPRPAAPSFGGGSHRCVVSRDVLDRLHQVSEANRATLFMTLLAAFKTLLHRYSGQHDIVVGSPIAARTRAELEALVGFFVNTLVLRTDLSGDPSFVSVLKRVREATLGAYDHQDLPFEILVNNMAVERDRSRNPLFQVAFVLQNAPAPPLQIPGLTIEAREEETGTAKFDLTLVAHESSDGLRLSLEYSTDLFVTDTIERMMKHLEMLLCRVAAEPDCRISQIPLLTPADRKRALVDWNETMTVYPRSTPIPALFEDQVRTAPQAIALEFGKDRWTYEELNRRANKIANQIVALGVGQHAIVAVCMQRSAAMVAATLGILKAGCAYLPLDAGYPLERLRFMLADSHAAAVVGDEALDSLLDGFAGTSHILRLDDQTASVSDEAPAVRVGAGDIAYVMYTSGSTGKPKGIAVPHRAIVRLVRNTNYVELDSTERIAQISNISFDAATFELWGALLNGGCLVGIGKDVALNPSLLGAAIRSERITTMFLTTALFNEMARTAPDAFNTMRNVLVGGEAADPAAMRAVRSHGGPSRLLNAYGPTESTTFAVCHVVTEVPEGAVRVPIGRPIANTTAYILDRHLEPAPVGVAGELYIGGDGLACGYWNRPELTAERFVPNPFGGAGESRLYRTGDLARYRADGTIEFLGRLDQQVKIRGYRIEPGEIEAALVVHPQVAQAIVVVREDTPGDRRLVANVVPAGVEAPQAGELRRFLQQRLPDYMIPSAFVVVPALPMNANGKVDRSALPAPGGERPDLLRPYAAPRDAIERALAAIWAQVLGLGDVGIHDSFFDLGGHSLLAMQLVSRVREDLGVEVPLQTIFASPTVAGVSESLREDPYTRQMLERVSALLTSTEGLSDDELEALLASGGLANGA